MKKLNILAIAAIFGLLITKFSLSMQDDIRNYGDFQDEEKPVRGQITYKMGEIDNLMHGGDSEQIAQEKIQIIINTIKETTGIKLKKLLAMGFDFDYIELANAQLLVDDKENHTNNALNKEIVAKREQIQDEEKFIEKVEKKEKEDQKHESHRIDASEFNQLINEELMDEEVNEDTESQELEANPEDVATIKLIVKAIKNPNDKSLSLKEWSKITQKLGRVKIEAVSLSTLIEKFGKTTVKTAVEDIIGDGSGADNIPDTFYSDSKYDNLMD